MNDNTNERRKSRRYDTEAKIYFHINYDLKTKVTFQLIDKIKKKFLSKKHLAFSKNVSPGGLCFYCDQKLAIGDLLKLEVYVPGVDKPIFMEGEVRWANPNPSQEEFIKKLGLGKYEIGVKLLIVDGKSVAESIYYDETYQVEWSIVLESVLGNYRIQAQKRNQK